MNVGRTLFERVGHDGVDKLDDRRFIDERLAGELVLVLALEDLDVVFVIDLSEQVLHLRFARRVELLDCITERELTGDDREDVQTGDELDVVEDRQRRRVGHRDSQSAAITLQWKHAVLHCELTGNELGNARIDLEFGQVDGGHLMRSVSFTKPSLTRL